MNKSENRVFQRIIDELKNYFSQFSLILINSHIAICMLYLCYVKGDIGELKKNNSLGGASGVCRGVI